MGMARCQRFLACIARRWFNLVLIPAPDVAEAIRLTGSIDWMSTQRIRRILEGCKAA